MVSPVSYLTAIAPPITMGDPNTLIGLGTQQVNQAASFTNLLAALLSGLAPQRIVPDFPTIASPPAPIVIPFPTLQEVAWTVPPPPAAFNGTLDISGLLPPPFTQTPPVLNFGTPPAAFSGIAPAEPPIDLNFTLPTLSVKLPTPPELLKLDTVVWTGVTLPTIDPTVPTLTAVAPAIILPGTEVVYSSPELTALRATLKDRFANGGTGLPAAIETAIWDRAREREFRQMADALADLDRMETFGFTFPPGVYLDARLKLQTEMQNVTAGLSRDVAIKQAELELQNILEALKLTGELEGKLIDYTNQVAQRAFEVSKYQTEAGIALYNANVEAYKATLEAHKTRVVIYEALVRAALSNVDIFKARIEAERTKAEIDKTLVDIYDTEAKIALSNIEIYKAEIGAIQTQAEIQKIKIEVYGEQIKAFVGQINAFTANVEGYKATVEAEGTKQIAFKTQVDAFAAQVNAGVAEIGGLVEAFKGRIAAKTVEYDGFKAAVAAATEQARAQAAFNQNKTDIFRAEVEGTTAYNELLTKQWEAVLSEQEKIAEVGVQAAQANATLYMSSRSLAIEAAKVGAQVAAQLGAAALSTVNFSQSANWSSANSNSASNSYSGSESDSKVQTSSVSL